MGDYQRFGAWDYVVFFATFIASLSIGVFFSIWDRKRDTPLNYFLAGRKSGIGPVTLSFIVTFQSSLMIIGMPPEVYVYGMKLTYGVLGIVTSYIVGALILVPVFHPLEFTSVYRYFEMRYHGNAVRYLTLFAGLLYNACYMGTVTFGTCVALEVVMGIPYWSTIMLYTVITTVYTSIGGIKAVIWSDVLQMVIMATGIVALLGKAVLDSGGLPEVMTLSASRLQMDDFRLDPTIRYQFWNASFGAFTRCLFYTCSQSGIQRINSTSSVKSARAVYIVAAPLYSIFYLLVGFQGVAFFAYYSTKGCDPIESGRAESYNQLVPLAVLDLFRNIPGLAGLFIASLSSGALSTLSSCLSSLSAITYDDVIMEKFPNISDKRATFVSKIVVVLYGTIGLIISFAVSKFSGTVVTVFIAFVGCFDGPYAAIFMLSVLSRRITSKGAFIGGLVGMITSFWIIMGQALTQLPQSHKLPPGPTDQCLLQDHLLDETLSENNMSKAYMYSGSTVTHTLLSSTSVVSMQSEITLSPLERLYSVSFVLFSLIGFVTTVLVAICVSFFTTETNEIDERCLFSFRKHVLCHWTIKTRRGVIHETGSTVERHELMSKIA